MGDKIVTAGVGDRCITIDTDLYDLVMEKISPDCRFSDPGLDFENTVFWVPGTRVVLKPKNKGEGDE